MDARQEKEPVAIIGIGCRFPGGADDPRSFWRLLVDGVDAVSEVPADRWNLDRYYAPEAVLGKTYSRWGGFLDNISDFEPEIFGISPREAAFIDPQQRLLLEVSWDALYDAGQVIESLAASATGVFVGISTSDYAQIQSGAGDQSNVGVHSATGGAFSIAANRISYCLDLRGPSIAVDTACSSSLVATDLACRSLWSGECELAIAGGVNAIISAGPFIGFCAASMLSPDGRCRTFDAGANGFVRGEGAGAVLLKPLSKALADGDAVYAVILGSAVNQDGRTHGLTMPSVDAQKALLREACRQAGVQPGDIQYVEAHGTGTQVGDPIEARALGTVLAEGRAGGECIIGSVKTNIGHLEAGAGIAGLIKTALALHARTIPPNLHFNAPNPQIPFDELRFRVPTQTEPWPVNGSAALAGVNSFGFGGTNAHLILAGHAPRRVAKAPAAGGPFVLPLSARTEDGLKKLAARLADDCRASPEVDVAGLCTSAALRRSHDVQRLALAVNTPADLITQLDAYTRGERPVGAHTGRRRSGRTPRLVFVYSGQGPQWWGMGRQLLQTNEVFRAAIRDCDRVLVPRVGWSVFEELACGEDASRLGETAIAQPALFALQVGLTEVWKSWGVRPAAVIGHSVGEGAAAWAAGALDLEQAMAVIAERGRAMAGAPLDGGMLALGISAAEAQEWIAQYAGRLTLAVINSPVSVTLSGQPDALREAEIHFAAAGRFCRALRVRHAFHSATMDPVRDDLLIALQGVDSRVPDIPIWSTVTGMRAEGGAFFDSEYWWRNVRETVHFGPAVQTLIREGFDTFVEIGPHPVLAGVIAECAHETQAGTICIASLRRGEDEARTLHGALGGLYTRGVALDWRKVFPVASPAVRLPAVPWVRESYWSESREARAQRLEGCHHGLLTHRVDGPRPAWSVELNTRIQSWLGDHRVEKNIVVPAAALVEMVLGAAREILEPGDLIIEQVQFRKALFVSEEATTRARLEIEPTRGAFRIYSESGDGEWVEHAVGYVRTAQEETPPGEALPSPQDCARIDQATCYQRFSDSGLNFGPAFRGVQELHIAGDGRQATGTVILTAQANTGQGDYCIHPAYLDACFQVLSGVIPPSAMAANHLFLPVRIERLRFFKSPGHRVLCHARRTNYTRKTLEGDLRIQDGDGRPVVEITGFACQAMDGRAGSDSVGDRWFYSMAWQYAPLADAPTAQAPFIPAPAALAGATDARVPKRYQDAMDELDALAVRYIHETLRRATSRYRGESFSLQELGIVPEQQREATRLLTILCDTGLAQKTATGWQLHDVKAAPPGELWTQILRRYPDCFAELSLIQRCGHRLLDVLRGRIEALQVLFPDGNLDTAEHFYQDSPSFRYYNRAVQEVVGAIVAALPDDRPLRVVEIGAGTGGLSGYLIPQLPRDRTEYLFTDVSNLFFARAQQRFRKYDFVDYRVFNIEKDAQEQGFTAGHFDLVLASDVLHATQSLRGTLQSMRTLLAPGGLLVVLEAERAYRWCDLVFGLTEGWWRFSDVDLRADHPLINRGAWAQVLRAAGYEEACHVATSEDDEQSGQIILLARQPAQSLPSHSEAPAPAEVAGTWLVLGRQGAPAAALARALRDAGGEVIHAHWAARFETLAPDHYGLPPDKDAMAQLFGAVNRPIDHIVLFGDSCTRAVNTIGDLHETQQHGCQAVMQLVQVMAETRQPGSLSVVTRGAQAFACPVTGIGDGSLHGLVRVIDNEFPDLNCRIVDLDSRAEVSEQLPALIGELLADNPEEEVVLRAGNRFCLRLRHEERALGNRDRQTRFRLDLPSAGALDRLRLREAPAAELGPGQVEIAVQATALNFRDVMKVLGMYPTDGGDYAMLGDECAGTISAIGPGVESFRVGDPVVAIAPASFASHVVTLAEFVIRRPRALTVFEAASHPIVYTTAQYALLHLARLQQGEKILIQAAAGGVGLAAIQIAQHVGAQIFATAGTAEKRALLRSLGVTHVMDSRTLAFADQVADITGGRGVDVVLNSLAGKALEKGLACLGPYGRFLELGKRDIYQDNPVGLWAFRQNLSFFAIDLSRMIKDRPAFIQQLLAEVSERLQTGDYAPLPHRVFPVSRIVDTFRHMAQGRHIGKVVVAMDEPGARIEKEPSEAVRFRRDGCYLITGGFGGFGVTLAKWIVRHGGGHIALMSRRGADSPGAQSIQDELRALGAGVSVLRGDVTDPAQVAAAVRELQACAPPLRGIFHTAMVLDDGVLQQLEPARFNRVLRPKVDGAWHLHQHTQNAPLEYFVLFSSVSALIGNQGQASYAAANSFLDAFAHYRHALGLPATAINWGRLAEVGYVSREKAVGDILTRRGVLGITPDDAMAALGRVLVDGPAQIGIMRIDWDRWASTGGPGQLAQRFGELVSNSGEDAGQGEDGERVRMAIQQADAEQRPALVETFIRQQVARVLGVAADRLDGEQPLNELGLDSLMGVELQHRVERTLAVSLPAGELMQTPTITRLVEAVLARIDSRGPRAAHRPRAPVEPQPVLLRSGGAETPLFCLHPAGGQLDIYRHLVSALNSGRPVYGIQSRLLDNGCDEDFGSLAEMARAYAGQITRACPSGPYLLLGFSLGGLIALETARQLETRGAHVAMIALVDCSLQWVDAEAPREELLATLIAETYELAQRELGSVKSLAPEQLLAESQAVAARALRQPPEQGRAVVSQWLRDGGYLTNAMAEQEIDRLLLRLNAHLALIDGYRPARTAALVHLWRGDSGLTTPDEDGRWAGVTGEFHSRTLPGSHFSLMTPPDVGRLAGEIDGALAAAERAPAKAAAG